MNHEGLGLEIGPAGAATGAGPEAPPEPDGGQADALAKIGDVAAAAGLRRIEMVAWRDLDHPEAGGSELHAARIAERWAAAGIDVVLTASRAPGAPSSARRDGYRVERPAGRYGIFPAVSLTRLPGRLTGRRRPAGEAAGGAGQILAGTAGGPTRSRRRSGPDGTVEIWNGMPFFSPVWAPRPRMVFLHHVHDGMWDLVMPGQLAAVGRFLESRVAPPLYRDTPVVTLSESSRQGILEILRLRPEQVSVVPPGVDESFMPGLGRSSRPLVVAVGRLVTYKRFDRLIDILVRLHSRHPDLRAVIAGEGSARPELEARVARHGAGDWLQLPGRVDDEGLIELYQRAWVLASTSAYEGWGLTISEAAACATPAVVSPIAGHLDAVDDGITGFLAEPGTAMEERMDALLRDPVLRRRMQKAALRKAALLTWDRTALRTLRVLAAQTGAILPWTDRSGGPPPRTP